MNIYLPQEGFKNYVDALESFGVNICHSEPEQCQGLLLPGGVDIDPALYGHENMGSVEINPERDKIELEAFERFMALGKPIFGICRGCQMINVLLGGTLFQDIPGHRQSEGDMLHESHTTDSLLIGLYGENFTINSIHHQAIDRLGSGLRPVQWAEDGTIEAVRHESLPIFAVQWHPERLRTPTDGWRLIGRWLETL